MFSFNAEEEKEFSNELPEQRYLVCIADAEYKPSKSNPSNYMVALKYSIIDDGEHNGWTLYDNFNVVNSNQIAQNIGRSELKKLCESCGILKFDEPQELIGAELAVETKNKVYQGRTSANVVGYFPPSELSGHIAVDDIPFG